MRGSIKLALGIGVLSLVALGVPACGDDDGGGGGGQPATGGTGGKEGGGGGTTGGGGGTTGGGGGTTGGGGGTTGGGGAGGTGGGGVTCGGTSCPDFKVAGIFTLAGCCAGSAKDVCGANVDSTVGSLIGVPAGCYATDQPGNADTTCAKLNFTNPLDGGPGYFSGCCNHKTSKCGYTVDVTSVGGPDFGCLDATGIADGGPSACTPSDGGTTDGGGDAPSDAPTDATGDAPTDAPTGDAPTDAPAG